MKCVTLMLLVSACGGASGGSRTQEPMDANTSSGMDANIDANACVPGQLCVTVTNSRSLPAPPLQAIDIWPMWGGMMPVTWGVTSLNDIGENFPTQFMLDLSVPPAADVLSFLASGNLHSIGIDIGLARRGSIYTSMGHQMVNTCDVWGQQVDGPALWYFTEAGAWLASEDHYTNTESYSQGYHLFVQRVNDAGPCMDPMCPGPTLTLIEVPLDTPITIDLQDPQTWCQ